MDTEKYRTKIETRLADLQNRLEHVETALDEPTDKDLEDQAIELEDDEVLEAVGRAGLAEIRLLNEALQRISAGSYGECKSCGESISEARLDAVPYAVVCRECAGAGAA